MVKSSLRRGLYAITPDTPDTDWLLSASEALVKAGCPTLQYRDKTSSESLRQRRAEHLARLCRDHGTTFIINDDIALARAVDADGVHLGASDGDLLTARAKLGPNKLLGASCYADLPRAQAAAQAGANYVAFGAFFPSPTKPNATTAPLTLLQAAKTVLSVPICAIGGITLANAQALVDAGADQIAVISDLFIPGANAKILSSRALAFQSLFQEAQS